MQGVRAVPMPGTKGRWMIIDAVTEEVLDDCSGKGFTTDRRAKACWKHTHKPEMMSRKEKDLKRLIFAWLRAHENCTLEDMSLMEVLEEHICELPCPIDHLFKFIEE